MIYCDTSLLLSLYVADSSSAEADRLLRKADEPLVWTAWHELEVVSALEARVGRGLNNRAEAEAVMRVISAHRQPDGFLIERRTDWTRVLEDSVRLAKNFGALHLCRSLDVVHVATCLTLGLPRFWSFDQRQRRLAEQAGLVINR